MKLVGERRALASAVFAFYFLAYGMLVMSGALPPEFSKAFAAIAGVYGLAFFALVAGYFWARWYAVGVGLYGVITAGVGMWQLGTEPVLVFLGGTHLAATLLLWGNAMSAPYDGQTAWREKLHMDDNAVQRLGRSVIRAGVSLPFVLLYALAPRLLRLSYWSGFALVVAVVLVFTALTHLVLGDSAPASIARSLVLAAACAAPSMEFSMASPAKAAPRSIRPRASR